MINALFIVWRECFEAVLIVGILYAFLKRQENPLRSFRFMWGGLAGGVILSAILAYGVQVAQTELQGVALELFEAGMLTTAAALMTHMCIWMKRHSRKLKGELEGSLRQSLSTAKLIGVASLAALAIAREGFELVMFFYGMGIEAQTKGLMAELLGYSAAGVGLTVVTAWAYYRGLKLFDPKLFFRVTAIFLFVTASGLLLAATRKLIQMDLLPTLKDQFWDTSAFLDERTGFGQFVNTVTGYESTPALITVLLYFGYWAVTAMLYFGMPKTRTAPNRSTPVEAVQQS